jgi:hypothetical protein
MIAGQSKQDQGHGHQQRAQQLLLHREHNVPPLRNKTVNAVQRKKEMFT